MKTLLLVKIAFLPLVALWVLAPYMFSSPRTAVLAIAGSQLLVAVAMAWSVLLGRPWTALFSATQWSGANRDPLFLRINTVISGLWAAMFFYLASARFLELAAMATWLPLAAAILASAILPTFLVHRALAKRIASADPYRWKAPGRGASGTDADVVVVGAGLGGLTAGALLADAGLRVMVLEQHVVAGGFAHTWLRKGRDGDARPVFRFDSGIHDVSGVWEGAPVHGLLRRLGVHQRLDWRRMDHRFVHDGATFDVPRGWEAYVDALAARYPSDREGITRAMADIREIHSAMYSEAPGRSGVPGAPATVNGMLAFARRHPLAVQWMPRRFADFLASANRLVDPSHWPRDFRENLSAMRPACSAIGVHLGVRGTFDGARPIIHVTGEHGSAGIVIPTLADPSPAPAGYSTVEVLRLLGHEEALQWVGDTDASATGALRETPSYLARKRAAGDALIRAAEQALPDLADRIVYRADASPVTFLRYDWSSAGAIYGCNGAPRRVAAKSPVPGILFAGAVTHGTGVEAVMISGALAAEALAPGLLHAPARVAPASAAALSACPQT